MARSSWGTSGGSSGYLEKTYPNRKVGHVMGYLDNPGSQTPKFQTWFARLDGVGCGRADTPEAAQALVEKRYKELYGQEK